MSVLPAELKNETPPAELSGTVTRFGTITPAAKLRLDTVGCVVPSGNAVRNPLAVGSTTVTLRTTAEAPDGTGVVPTPVTCTLSVEAAARVWPAYVVGSVAPVRVSTIRKGVTET